MLIKRGNQYEVKPTPITEINKFIEVGDSGVSGRTNTKQKLLSKNGGARNLTSTVINNKAEKMLENGETDFGIIGRTVARVAPYQTTLGPNANMKELNGHFPRGLTRHSTKNPAKKLTGNVLRPVATLLTRKFIPGGDFVDSPRTRNQFTAQVARAYGYDSAVVETTAFRGFDSPDSYKPLVGDSSYDQRLSDATGKILSKDGNSQFAELNRSANKYAKDYDRLEQHTFVFGDDFSDAEKKKIREAHIEGPGKVLNKYGDNHTFDMNNLYSATKGIIPLVKRLPFALFDPIKFNAMDQKLGLLHPAGSLTGIGFNENEKTITFVEKNNGGGYSYRKVLLSDPGNGNIKSTASFTPTPAKGSFLNVLEGAFRDEETGFDPHSVFRNLAQWKTLAHDHRTIAQAAREKVA